ncbi:MAG: histidinol-phosphate transaminase [Clostridiales bacterium]|nr:histidinol-phosphate transaminase [Clostridiales bacterium]
MSRFLNQKYASLEVYTPGEQPRDMKYIKLNTNESPYPPAPGVLEAVQGEVDLLRLYSDPECAALRDAIAELHGLKRENTYVANGSDDILNFAFMAFAGNGVPIYFPDISYGFYKVFAELNGIEYHKIPLKEDFSIDPADYMNVGGMIAIANPNAPTGLNLSVAQIESILKANPDNVVLIDEAYVDFGGESCYPLIEKYDNLLVVQTFSKSRSMAGARLGFALASKPLIEDLNRLKFSTNPYNVNRMTLSAGLATIRANDYYMDNCKKIMATREETTRRLEELGFEVIPSCANFIFAKSNKISGEDLYQNLKKRGVLVRHFTSDRISDFNRISIGTAEEMQRFVEVTRDILEER